MIPYYQRLFVNTTDLESNINDKVSMPLVIHMGNEIT